MTAKTAIHGVAVFLTRSVSLSPFLLHTKKRFTSLQGNVMTISELLQYCMNKPGAEQSVHSDWKATQIKVSDVLFAMVKEVEGRPATSLKTSPELAELLREQHSDVRPSQHLNKAHWSTVYLDGSLPDSQIYFLVDASYQQAMGLLPEEIRQQLE